MRYHYKDPLTDTNLLLLMGEPSFSHSFFADTVRPVLTIAWNRGINQRLFLDGTAQIFPSQTVAPLVMNQTFRFERPQDLVIWQFDTPFYCIETHDSEVSCIGFLFWGNRDFCPIQVAEKDGMQTRMEMILQFFLHEFQTEDRIQSEMLRALLKRMIVTLTRTMRKQAINPDFRDSDLDIVRQFNVLVEKNFRHLHQVQDYAHLMDRSPKTLTNLFALYNHKSPLEVIHGRIILEARRLLLYTDQSVSQIAEHLGFEVSHFSRLFKKVTGFAPMDWRREQPYLLSAGDIGKSAGGISIPTPKLP